MMINSFVFLILLSNCIKVQSGTQRCEVGQQVAPSSPQGCRILCWFMSCSHWSKNGFYSAFNGVSVPFSQLKWEWDFTHPLPWPNSLFKGGRLRWNYISPENRCISGGRKSLTTIGCCLKQRCELEANSLRSAAAMPAVLWGAGEAAAKSGCRSFTGGRVVPGQNELPSSHGVKRRNTERQMHCYLQEFLVELQNSQT